MANNRMRRYARMAMASNGGRNNVRVGDYSGNRIEHYYGRMEDGRMTGTRMESGHGGHMRNEGGRMNYGAESRFRDRRGRWHYDNGRFAPRSNMGGMTHDTGEMNYGPDGRRGRRARSDFDSETYAPWGPYGDDEEDDGRVMNRIGFSLNGEMGHPSEFGREYRNDAGYYPMNEMDRRSSAAVVGRASCGSEKLTPDKAREWVSSMQNEDGSKGGHWTMEQTRQLQNQKGLANLDPTHFWAAINMMYSDYCSVFERAGISKPDLYADLAKAFLMDKDAHKDKLDRYWCYVVKR